MQSPSRGGALLSADLYRAGRVLLVSLGVRRPYEHHLKDSVHPELPVGFLGRESHFSSASVSTKGLAGFWLQVPLTKHEDLSPIPRIHLTKLGMVMCAYNPSTGRLRWVHPLGLIAGHLSHLFQASKRPHLTERRGQCLRDVSKADSQYMHTHGHLNTHAYGTKILRFKR